MSRLEGQTVVLTGATGFIGRRLLNRLKSESCARVVVISRSSLDFPGVDVLSADLCALTRRHWAEAGVEKIDVIFHLAGATPKSAATPPTAREHYRNNLHALERMLAEQPSTGRIVYASTLDVYGQATEEVLSENTPIAPANLYAASKIFGEEMVREACATGPTRFSILRYGHIYGPGEEAYQKLIPATIRALKAGQPPTIFGEGAELRDFLFVDDAVEATIRAACVSGDSLEPINLVSGASVSVRRIVELLCRLSEGIAPVAAPFRGTPRSFRFDNARMRTVLGEWPLVPLAEGLRQEWEQWSPAGG